MSQKVDVRAIHALDDFRGALTRFRGEAEAALREMEAAIRHVRQHLAERETHWKRQAARWEAEHKKALAALAACRSQAYRDPNTGRTYVPPCTQEQEWIMRTRVELERATAALRTVREWRKAVERAVEEYRRQARRLAAHLEENVPKAAARLERHASTLRAYTGLIPAPATSIPPSSIQPVANTAVAEALSVMPGNTIQEISLDSIDWEEMGALASDDYRKVSRDEMREGLRKLVEVVRPKVQQGATAEDFSRMDEELGLDYAHGYRRVYDAFYGPNECIVVERVGDTYQVINGRHRLLLAREMGIESLPARVLGK